MKGLRMGWDRLSLVAAVLFHLVAGWWWIGATPLQDIDLPDNVPPALPYSTLRVGLGPDEKEHYLVARSLAEGRGMPAPDPSRRKDDTQWVSYQVQHPPLAYAVLAMGLRIAGGMAVDIQWVFLRLICLGWGAVGVAFGGLAIQRAFPGNRLIGNAGPWILAALPMLGHMNGNVSNEPQAAALAALAWFLLVDGVRGKRLGLGRVASIAFLLGLAGLSRLTALVWLPGVAWVIFRHAAGRWKMLAVLGVSIAVTLGPWMAWNVGQFGQPVLRTFDRPFFPEGSGFADLLASGVTPPGSQANLTLASVVLWFAGCAWTPLWLIQFYLPGGPVLLSGVLALMEIALGLMLANHVSRSRRGLDPGSDPVGRDLLRAAALVLSACLLGQIQQMFFSDWNVVFSNGRYTVAAAGASSLLLVFAVNCTWKRPWARTAAGFVVVVGMLAFDLFSVGLVRRFYRDNPTQEAVQPIVSAQR